MLFTLLAVYLQLKTPEKLVLCPKLPLNQGADLTPRPTLTTKRVSSLIVLPCDEFTNHSRLASVLICF